MVLQNDKHILLNYEKALPLLGALKVVLCYAAFRFIEMSITLNYHNLRANGAKRRSGRKPGARVTYSARLFTPGPGKSEHSEV